MINALEKQAEENKMNTYEVEIQKYPVFITVEAENESEARMKAKMLYMSKGDQIESIEKKVRA